MEQERRIKVDKEGLGKKDKGWWIKKEYERRIKVDKEGLGKKDEGG